jgi:hypothetical protein
MVTIQNLHYSKLVIVFAASITLPINYFTSPIYASASGIIATGNSTKSSSSTNSSCVSSYNLTCLTITMTVNNPNNVTSGASSEPFLILIRDNGVNAAIFFLQNGGQRTAPVTVGDQILVTELRELNDRSNITFTTNHTGFCSGQVISANPLTCNLINNITGTGDKITAS